MACSWFSAWMMLVYMVVCFLLMDAASAGNFYEDFGINWGDGHAKILNDGQLLTLSLDKVSGSGFQSKNDFLFGKFDMQIKLVSGNSAGTVTAYYLSSQGSTHDELDFEFLGNLSGEPYVAQTNVFIQGKGEREQRIFLWFDPTKDFHTYSILWNPKNIIFYVDGIPITQLKNMEPKVLYAHNQPMKIYSSIWEADWATRGGLIKIDWTQAPFTSSFTKPNLDTCSWVSGTSSCASSNSSWMTQELDPDSQGKLMWVQKNYMIYNYCKDFNRFPQGLPLECASA